SVRPIPDNLHRFPHSSPVGLKKRTRPRGAVLASKTPRQGPFFALLARARSPCWHDDLRLGRIRDGRATCSGYRTFIVPVRGVVSSPHGVNVCMQNTVQPAPKPPCFLPYPLPPSSKISLFFLGVKNFFRKTLWLI